MENETQKDPHITSLSYVQKCIFARQISLAYETLSKEIENKQNDHEKSKLYVNRALIELELQMTKHAITDSNMAIELNKSQSAAYFTCGIAHLWNKNEDSAMTIWKIGIKFAEDMPFFVLMTALINNLNFRANMFKLKFNVLSILSQIEEFATPRFSVDSDLQDAFAELRTSSIEYAIEHFSMIIRANTEYFSAYKGRGIAYCMIGEYKKCIQDLTTAMEKTPNSFQTDTVKVRAIALAATGNITRAIIDLNKYLLVLPNDYEVKIEVARLHMKRKTYFSAHKLFLSIPEKSFDEKAYISFAECLYAVGELYNAAIILHKVNNIRDHKYHYVRYLIYRDLNEIEEAKEDIIEAVRLVPTFFLLRTAADFFSDLGEIRMALDYYEEALQQCPYDAETHLFYALSLFEAGKLPQSAQLLRELSVENEKFRFSGSLEHFNKMNSKINLLKMAEFNYYLVTLIMNSGDSSIMTLPRKKPSSTTVADDIPNSFVLCSFELTKQIKQMIKDADRLGARCITNTTEKTANKRLIRALGFCILRLTFMMKSQWFESQPKNWESAFDEIRAILSFADMRNLLTFTNNSKEDQNEIVYYIMKNGRNSSRFGFALSKVFQMIRSNFSSQEKVENFEDFFQIYQTDLVNESKWEIEKGTKLDLPYIMLKYNGIFGFDIIVTPKSDQESWNEYDKELQTAFQNLMKKGEESTWNLGFLIILIWLRHPLSFYSPEIGHVFLHAFVLASAGSEIAVVDESSGENFFMQMIAPNLSTFSNQLYEHALNNALQSQFSEESIQFWSAMPSVSAMIHLLNATCE